MVKIKVIRPCWIKGSRAVPGSLIDLPRQEAWDLIKMGRATLPTQDETAEAPQGETRVVKSKRKVTTRKAKS